MLYRDFFDSLGWNVQFTPPLFSRPANLKNGGFSYRHNPPRYTILKVEKYLDLLLSQKIVSFALQIAARPENHQYR